MTEVNPQWPNFEGIVKEVLEFGFNDGPQTNRKRIEGWINEGLINIARKVNSPEFQKSEILTLVKGQYKYPLPADFLRVQDIYFPERSTRLTMIDLHQFDAMGHSEGGVGRVEAPPMYYTLYGTELWLFPIPPTGGASEQIELRYIARPPYLKATSDVPVLNPDYWHLLIQYAVTRAFEAEDDFEAAAQHMTRYKVDLDEYATDVQFRVDDRPHVIDGTWGGLGTAGARGVL